MWSFSWGSETIRHLVGFQALQCRFTAAIDKDSHGPRTAFCDLLKETLNPHTASAYCIQQYPLPGSYNQFTFSVRWVSCSRNVWYWAKIPIWKKRERLSVWAPLLVNKVQRISAHSTMSTRTWIRVYYGCYSNHRNGFYAEQWSDGPWGGPVATPSTPTSAAPTFRLMGMFCRLFSVLLPPFKTDRLREWEWN